MKISVVIPVINEAALIEQAIASSWAAGMHQVIVVDGGSTDGTEEIARQQKCEWLHSEPGRAVQQNAGAAFADGDLLLFLHVDTVLPVDAADQLRQAVKAPRGFGGFRQTIGHPGRLFRWIEAGNAWRIQRCGMVYGDQGLFLTRATWQELGPFPEEPLMEDYILSRRLRKRLRPILLPGPLQVDPRRWMRHGVIRQTVRNRLIATAYLAGVSPTRLAAYYRRHDR
ncbi:MAG: TIGR04283 family arsenosugar biosynthesis glycosyltransferase [Planctomycetota bacterium]|nr:TIGR04283 family arsenosugar biosynthesis glycosyltransferase [Planctomycetota bacterium]